MTNCTISELTTWRSLLACISQLARCLGWSSDTIVYPMRAWRGITGLCALAFMGNARWNHDQVVEPSRPPYECFPMFGTGLYSTMYHILVASGFERILFGCAAPRSLAWDADST